MFLCVPFFFSSTVCFEKASWHKIGLHLTSSNLLLWKLIFHMVLTTLLIWTSRFMFPYLVQFSMYGYKFYKLNCPIVANFKVPLERPLSSGPRPNNSSHCMLFYLLLVCCGTVLFFSQSLCTPFNCNPHKLTIPNATFVNSATYSAVND